MIKIAKVLMNYGMEFRYEHHGSNGEEIISLEMGLDVSNQNGKIYYSCMSSPEVFEESEIEYMRLSALLEEECIAQTC